MNWKEIVSTHGERIFRSAYRILHQDADAEDVAQDVLLEAYRMLQRDGRLPDGPLLRRMATLRAIDRLRTRRVAEPLEERALEAAATTPVDRIESEEQILRLQHAIARLPPQQANCFALRYIEGLSNQEIAELNHLSPTAVSTALSKARENLRAVLEPACDMGESK